MAERGPVMLLHSMIIGIIIYVLLITFGVDKKKAENRSILIASVISIYMILFGHGLPINFNQQI